MGRARHGQARAQAAASTPSAVAAESRPSAAGASAAALLAMTIALVPAVGVPSELLLQDTLKSIVVAFGTLGAALLLFWDLRRRQQSLHWHAALWLPLALMAFALGSMAWSHAYLAGVEAVRWFLLALLGWLAMQVFTRERLPWLAWGVHAGALAASLWAALQFWVDLQLFPQGPNPASTFVNRNFFAEFAVCTLPFSLLLLARMRRSAAVALLAASNGFVVVALLMTGTRSALVALWLLLLVAVPLVAWRCRAVLPMARWSWRLRGLALAVLAATVVGLGSIPAGNASILDEGRGQTPLERALRRTGSIAQPADEALNIRFAMWRATLRLISDHPLAGVGAGAWEVQIPRYQGSGQPLESDYYPHNEVLQLLAEDGLVGWLAMLALGAWLARSALRTWRIAEGGQRDEAPWRAAMLASIGAFLLVANAGFPLHLAAGGALFALVLGVLAGSDARLGWRGRWDAQVLQWQGRWATPALGATGACLALALVVTEQAAACEARIVRATQLAYAISASGDWNDPRWSSTRAEIVRLTREAVAINPHYRKITPIVADELARWGDWKDALWIWDSVLASRPSVVAILANVARANVALERWPEALAALERAKRVAPDAPGLVSLEVILLARTGHESEALASSREALAKGPVDGDLLQAAFVLGWRAGDLDLAERALTQRLQAVPQQRVDDLLKLGAFYLEGRRDEGRAVQAWRGALAAAPPAGRAAVLREVPEPYRARLGP